MYKYKDTEEYHTCLCVSTYALCYIQCIVDFWWFCKYAKNIFFDNSKFLNISSKCEQYFTRSGPMGVASKSRRVCLSCNATQYSQIQVNA